MTGIPPFVSVIIPFFNHSDWLKEALDSVAAQTYPHWEAIVFDDGSSSEHSLAARNYCAGGPPNFSYYEHDGHVNRGVTITRNAAVAKARGNFIAFLDADDIWLPGKLDKQLALFAAHPEIGLCCEASQFWYSWRDDKAEDPIVDIGAPADRVYPPGQLNRLLYPLGPGASACPSGIVITRDAYNRSGGFEPVFSGRFQLYEDQAFLAKAYLQENVFISGTANNKYRKRDGSVSSVASDPVLYHEVRLFFIHWLLRYLEENDIGDGEIQQLLMDARDAMLHGSQPGITA